MDGREVIIDLGGPALPGSVSAPPDPLGFVVFAHGSGSSRHSPRNRSVAEGLGAAGLATLLFDLLTEEESRDRDNVFDIPLLADRVVAAIDWAADDPVLGGLPVGSFGASTGAAAALDAAAARPDRVGAVVSRGGRPDLAGRLADVACPVLLIVGSEDGPVIGMNERAAGELSAPNELELVAGAGHLFEGPGQLEAVTDLAAAWFRDHLAG